MFNDLSVFISTDPKIPEDRKNYISAIFPRISVDDSRNEIIDKIRSLADRSETALITLYIFRKMDMISWLPFVKAAIERNPVCFNDLGKKSTHEVFEILDIMPDHSIYDDLRLALPDEVWNFKRGDGIEKAMLLADYILLSDNSASLTIEIENRKVLLRFNGEEFRFTSYKSFRKTIEISGNNYIIN
jgi:hypothetical protein